ncbi:hypothetical protein FHW12_002898 [Dokdonella fugitiva]|uniref:Uncharacterized protein n=1 Tax=Dokdonella fugitiva TaxID=328517 RepID=A0A839EY30_9GAMM|nr:hypothetical protein [Dokdonella fugitiva]MBA8888665.1 hypothetical protein [Dokdonella fugitiva]
MEASCCGLRAVRDGVTRRCEPSIVDTPARAVKRIARRICAMTQIRRRNGRAGSPTWAMRVGARSTLAL